jgi:hypothetical protein
VFKKYVTKEEIAHKEVELISHFKAAALIDETASKVLESKGNVFKTLKLHENYTLIEFNQTLSLTTCSFCLFAGDYIEHKDE